MTAMNTRYKITRLDSEGNPTLTLEECQQYFATQADFEYHDSFGASQDGVHMKIKGYFFMWQIENAQIPSVFMMVNCMLRFHILLFLKKCNKWRVGYKQII